MRVDKTLENMKKAENVLSIYQSGDRRDKKVSVRDYVLSRISKLDRYDVGGWEMVKDRDGQFIDYDELIELFGEEG